MRFQSLVKVVSSETEEMLGACTHHDAQEPLRETEHALRLMISKDEIKGILVRGKSLAGNGLFHHLLDCCRAVDLQIRCTRIIYLEG